MRKNMGKTPMSELLQKLTRSCFANRDALDVARTQAAPVSYTHLTLPTNREV